MIAAPELREAPVRALDLLHDELRSGTPAVALDRLFAVLRDVRDARSRSGWLGFVESELRHHPISAAMLEDPMIRRSQEKPRGYPGDAVLLDYIYRLRDAGDATDLGRAVWDHTTATRPAALAVQARRRILARSLDALTARPAGQRRALVVACGHFREGRLSSALRDGVLDEVVCLDSDQASLAVVTSEWKHRPVRAVARSATRLLGADDLGTFDLVYSAGLYDYLEAPFARRLTSSLFDRLRTGGQLLICNFVPQIYDAAYMESFMAWRLIYRTEAELAGLADEIPLDQRSGCTAWTDSFDAVAYLSVARRNANATRDRAAAPAP
ncbi:MAG: class I SAM-dependent methyltransferase [Planctomycetota bacterium]